MDRDTVYKLGVKSGLLVKGQDFGFKFDEVMKFAALVAAEKDKEIDRLRGEVETLDKACKYHANNASELGRSLEMLEHDYAAMKAERDAALALLRELVETRDKHYIYQSQDVMPRWDERVAAAIDAARREA